LMIVVSGMCP